MTSERDEPIESGATARGADVGAPADAGARAFAVDPGRNVVLEASAGTGKTGVLVTRYLNLIRAGVDPSNILAITFTRKAAAEMRERILRELRRAATMSPVDAARWRGLRDRPGDIAVSTIDAFCLSLLGEFPLEADLDPGFAVADETELLRLTEEVLDRTLRVARRLSASDETLSLLFARLGEPRLRRALGSLVGRRQMATRALGRFLAKAPEGLSVRTACGQAFGRVQAAFDAIEGGRNQFELDGPVGNPGFRLLVADLHTLSETRSAGLLRGVIEQLRHHLFTKDGTPRQRLCPPYRAEEFLSAEARKRHTAAVKQVAPAIGEATAAFDRDLNTLLVRGLRRIFVMVRTEYRRALDASAVVDFAEALARALKLVGRMDEFARSRYRLEARYHHVLVDEFQDTSPAQWQLVARLIAAWGQGAGLSHDTGLEPSVFVVGDRKQSIYAFRDADVRVLRTAGRHIAALREDRDVRRSLTHSFRAVPSLLAFANDLFTEMRKNAERDDAFRYRASDRFPVPPDEAATGEAGVGLVVADDAPGLAETVAAEIDRLLTAGVVRDRQTGLRRPAAPGDIAILFRARASHRPFEQALLSRRVPTYVYRGLGFFDMDEIKDLAALVRYLAQPESNLRTTALLRSRIVRLSDAGLQTIAPDLARAVTADAAPAAWAGLGEEDQAALSRLRVSAPKWLALVDRTPPAELLDRVLADSAYALELRGPQSAQARENVKKMRALVRRIQNRGYATLGRIAEHLDRLSTGDESNATIDAAGAVNLMTVHAAKGLEFPVVFAVNLERGAASRREPVLVASLGRNREPLVSIEGMVGDADALVAARDGEETKRLLYVAVTRARDHLYLGAVLRNGQLKTWPGSLAEVLPESFKGLFARARSAGAARVIEWEATSGRHHRIRVSVPSAEPTRSVTAIDAAARKPAGAPTEAEAGEIIADDLEPLVDLRVVSRTTVSASVAIGGGPEGPAAWPKAAMTPRQDDAALEGTLVHRLFQFESVFSAEVPPLEEIERRAAALARAGGLVPAGDPAPLFRRAATAYAAMRQRADLRALVRHSTCLFEVPFSLAIESAGETRPGSRGIVRGTIDCLARLPSGGLTVIDFKTGARRNEHAAQVDFYVRAARALFPGADIKGLLIYPPGL